MSLCRLRRLAVERQARDLERLPALGYRFDQAEADRVVTFIERFCKHYKGEWAGKPLTLEPWQKDEILRPVFGWFRPDGTRRFRVVYIEIPRKGGKTILAAGVGLYLMGPDGEPGAEIYTIATKEEQAKICHDAAKAMVKQSTDLQTEFKTGAKHITCEKLSSAFRPLGRDSKTQDGLNAHGVIADEMHAHKERHLFDVLQTSMGARRQPLTFIITTAGVYDPASIGWEMHEDAVKILEGAVSDDSFFAYVTSADEEDDWRSPETWKKANPNVGVSVKESYLVTECERAKRSATYENTFKRYFCNLWTEQVTRWIPLEAWNACPSDVVIPTAGRRCFGGLDLSTKIDLAAGVLLFPPDDEETGVWDLLVRCWVPEELVKERTRAHRRPDYAAWVRDGYLTATSGNVIDYTAIRNEWNSMAAIYDLIETGFDPWNASQIGVELNGDGITMVEMRQGFKTMSEPAKAFEALVRSQRLRHGDHPIMRWAVSNVTVREDPNGNIQPDKSTAAGKIDPVVAAIMALGRAILMPATADAGVSVI